MAIGEMSPDGDGGSTPRPDPTLMTTAALMREVASLRDYIDGQLEVRDERLSGIDRATELRLSGIQGIPDQIHDQVTQTRALMDERFSSFEALMAEQFRSVAQQFTERDTRSERESRDNKVAVDAAFAAQKEAASEQNKSNTLAISKSETAVNETINKLAQAQDQSNKALADKIDDIKERVQRVESVKTGGQQAYAGIIAAAGFILVLLLIAGAVLAFTR